MDFLVLNALTLSNMVSENVRKMNISTKKAFLLLLFVENHLFARCREHSPTLWRMRWVCFFAIFFSRNKQVVLVDFVESF